MALASTTGVLFLEPEKFLDVVVMPDDTVYKLRFAIPGFNSKAFSSNIKSWRQLKEEN
jgi:hypothetical protein